MNEKEYLKNCKRTWNNTENNMLHCAMGISTEAGEILDAYKKSIFYGRELDIRNIKEEIGDCLYYIAILCEEVGYTMEDARRDNIEKLAKRYPGKFEDVVVRDVEKELNHINKSDFNIPDYFKCNETR